MIAKVDGRKRRSEVTRERIVVAMKSLIDDGNVAPTTEQIARRASVSTRSVFFRFRDTAALYLAVMDKVFDEIMPRIPPIPPTGPTLDRIHTFVERRSQVCEELRHYWRTGNVLFAQNPTIGARGEMARAITRARIEETFAPEIGSLDSTVARRLVDALSTASDYEVWDTMRRYQSRTYEEARATLETLILGAMIRFGAAPAAQAPTAEQVPAARRTANG